MNDKPASLASKQQCTCVETCKRMGQPFPADWSWRCQQLPYTQAWRAIDEADQIERLLASAKVLHAEIAKGDALVDTLTAERDRLRAVLHRFLQQTDGVRGGAVMRELHVAGFQALNGVGSVPETEAFQEVIVGSTTENGVVMCDSKLPSGLDLYVRLPLKASEPSLIGE